MAKGSIDYNKKIEQMLMEMPDFNDEQLSLLNTVRYGTNLPDKTLKRHKIFAERDSAMFLLLLDTGLRVSLIKNRLCRRISCDRALQ